MPKPRSAVKKPPLWLVAAEARVLLELGAFMLSKPAWGESAKGNGHPVIVYPGFLVTNISTLPLRHYLSELGYRVFGWKHGRNTGPQEEMIEAMVRRVKRVRDRTGQKVSLIGWSLGGVYAREVAKADPENVRQVITLGSPLTGKAGHSNLEWLFDRIAGEKVAALDPRFLKNIHVPPSVPTTAIFSKTDGIVPWRAAIEAEDEPHLQNIEVGGSHIGLGMNPLTLFVIADRLAQDPKGWEPFDWTLWRDFSLDRKSLKNWPKRKRGLNESLDRLEVFLSGEKNDRKPKSGGRVA